MGRFHPSLGFGTAFGEGSLRKLHNPTTFHTHAFQSPRRVTWRHRLGFGRFLGQKLRGEWGEWGLMHYGTVTEGTLGPNRSRIAQRIRHCLHLTEQLVVLHPLLLRQLT